MEPRSYTLAANVRRNANGGLGRLWRWRAARDAAWTLLDRHVERGAAVAVIGAGNGHDLPLGRLGRRAGRLDLVDLDAHALRSTRRRLRLAGVRAGTVTQDVTGGAAEAVIRGILAGRPVRVVPTTQPIGRPPHDVVIADQFLSQLLYPALSDSHLSGPAVGAALRAHGQALTNAVVQSLLAAAPVVILVEDVLGWWEGHEQPFALADVLTAEQPLTLIERGKQPRGCNGRTALTAARAQVLDRAVWHWPFAAHTDYLVCATVATTKGRPRSDASRCSAGSTG